MLPVDPTACMSVIAVQRSLTFVLPNKSKYMLHFIGIV